MSDQDNRTNEKPSDLYEMGSAIRSAEEHFSINKVKKVKGDNEVKLQVRKSVWHVEGIDTGGGEGSIPAPGTEIGGGVVTSSTNTSVTIEFPGRIPDHVDLPGVETTVVIEY